MEKMVEKKTNMLAGDEDVSGKAIRISLKHRALLEQGRNEINKDSTYKKKISYTRYVEKLIEDHWSKAIEDLKKERIGDVENEAFLKAEHKREAPEMMFYEWLRTRHQGNTKKSSKSTKGGEK